ncbi:MAG: anti-sigma factor antagonist [Streptosporangiales bacterium]|nr:anti-sigma factor antagonist [Streptosporangiales bacterium]
MAGTAARSPAYGVVMVEVSGELDIATRDRLRAEVEPWLRAGRELVLEVSGLTFIDASGLAGLLELDRLAGRAGTRLLIAGHSRPVHRLLQMTGLDGHFGPAERPAARPRLPLEPLHLQPGDRAPGIRRL